MAVSSISPRLSSANTIKKNNTVFTSTRPATAAAHVVAAGIVTSRFVNNNICPNQRSVSDGQMYPGPALRCVPGAQKPPVLVLNTLGNSSVLRKAPPPLPADIPALALQQPWPSDPELRQQQQQQAAGPMGKPNNSQSVSLSRHVGLTGEHEFDSVEGREVSVHSLCG